MKTVVNILNKESLLSTCSRRKVSCFLVTKDGDVVKGHNGGKGTECKKGCLRNNLNITPGTCHSVCYGIHAEIDMIKNCISMGLDMKGACVYSIYTPCSDCAKVLSKYQIKSFFYLYSYPDVSYLDMFEQEGIECKYIGGE